MFYCLFQIDLGYLNVCNSLLVAHRPKDGHVFDILFFLKTAFKKHALDNFKESDCLNKEAFR